MSHGELIPPGVEERDAELLRRAYALETQEEGAELYREWAKTYDRTMLDGLGYISPQRLAERFAAHAAADERPVLDLGCGTGLVGAELAHHGFTVFDGLDLSTEMMSEADRRGIYRSFVVADLNRPLPIESGTYAAAICNGTFTSGHVGAGCLDEILRVIAPGGVFAAAVHHSVWDALGFADAFERLIATGQIETLEIVESEYYLSSPEPDGRLCVFRRT